MNIPITILLVVLVVAIICLTDSDFRYCRKLKNRESMSDAEFFRVYYENTNVSEDIVQRLRPIYCDYFQIDPGKLRPLDWPPLLAEQDTSDLAEAIETEFGLVISDKDAENINGSFDSIVKYIAEVS